MPLITPLPTPPSRADATNFDTRADAFLGALPTFQSEANTVATNMETQYNYVAANVSTTTTNAAQATSAANSAVTARNQIEVLFLGSKSSNPTTNNQGGALTVGCKYFNTTVSEDRVWTGTNWVASTAIGGTVAGLNVDGELKLKSNTWHKDAQGVNRLYFEYGGSDATIIKGNQLVYWNNSSVELFKVVNNGGMYCFGQASVNAGGGFMSGHALTVGGTNGGGNTIGLGVTTGGQGSLGQIGADGNHLFVGPNSYYATGNDRFAFNGYAPRIRLFANDNRILFQQTDNGIAGNAQVQDIAGEFDQSGVFIVRAKNGYGYTALQGGGTTNAGFISFHRNNGERTGYVGYASNSANSPNLIVSENNHPWIFAGKAAQSDTDAAVGQELPRLSQFPSSNTANGYAKLPNGFIIQWGEVTIGSSGTNITLPVTFPNLCTSVLVSCTTNNLARASIINNSTINVACNPSTPQRCYWIAVGY